ncbi:glycosyltransferase, partial [Candidatus Pacearchaeota archaeon]|nr:glycosyltransferase [Candidatus Pacearchaeota archaeon]
GIPIANGKITGEPPIPFLSTVRTQLLDLHYNLKKIKNNTGEEVYQRIFSENYDYYYHLSDTNYTHLETPEYLNKIQSLDDIESWITQLLSGLNFSRPIVDYQHKSSTIIPPRGGNTLILNPKSIRDYPNISPRIGNTSFRRGDRFWCILNYYHGGRIITESPIAVKHTRTLKREDAFSFSRLLSDFYGSSFVKAMEDYYTTKNDELGWTPRRIQLSLSEVSIETIISLFNKHLLDRVTNFTMNAYRINGLLKNIRKQLNNITDLSYSIHKELDFIESTFLSDNISMFKNISLAINYEELKQFLRLLKQYVKTYRDNISTKITNREIVHSKVTLTNLGLLTRKDDVKLLGYGDEGTVFTDGKKVFKHFFYGKSGFPENIYDFVFKKMLHKNTLSHFSKLTEIVDKDGELVFVFPFEDSTNYNGGQIDDIQDFLLESKSNGIVVTNVHPKNFVLVDGVLKHVDIGSSIIPYSEKEYLQMCKRAYLTYRWHFRKDLSKLMAISLFNEDIPELFGYQYFLETLKIKTKEETLDPTIINIVTRTGPCSVLDYGCGKGKISEELATLGCSVVSYDVNYQQIEKNIAKHTQVKYLTLENLSAQYGKFDKVLCSLVLCTIESDKEVTHVVRDLRKYVEDSGEAIVVICNPFNTFVVETETHVKGNLPDETYYNEKFSYLKYIKETGNTRKETHRPFSYYEHLFHREGLEVTRLTEIRSTDVRELAPASDFMMIHLKPLTIPVNHNVSLMIKASAMEWKSIDFQIKHIVNQLEGPQRFQEKIVVTDNYLGPYLRQYTEPDFQVFIEKLNELKREGVIDRVIVVEDSPNEIRSAMEKWFNLDTSQARCSNGQPTYTILEGFEEVESRYFLHVDSDCIFVRKDRDHDYLGDMVEVLESDPDAISVSFNIAHEEDVDHSHENNGEPWRIETRCSLIARTRLLSLLPLTNCLDENGLVKYPWHRALDKAIKQQRRHSYRGGDKRTCYVHVPNNLKTRHNQWYNVVKAAERGQVPISQMDHVDLQSVRGWLCPVEEEFVLLVRGLNVPIPKLRRCLESILSQDYSRWKVIFIDAGSMTPMQEYLEKVALKEFDGKCTFWFNHERLTSMENIYIASTELCVNPESIIVHLDADDAFINTKVLGTLRRYYNEGADLTVGSMLRTDKHKEYPVNFDARSSRGGNVWQHLRSYRKYLFDEIPLEYFKIRDKWVPIAEDWAFMVPLTELAKNPIHIIEPFYFYQPVEIKSNSKLQLRENVIKEIISRPGLKRL